MRLKGRIELGDDSANVGSQKDTQATRQDPGVTASVVIAAFTFDRWDQIVKAVASVQSQSRPPVELILSIDRNPDLLRACQDRWGSADLPVPVRVIANHYAEAPRVTTEGNSDGVARGYSGGGARNSGAESATGDVIVITDDDAWAEPDWLEHLIAPYNDSTVIAVGGKPVPEFETQRPAWFPRSFDWVFGCAYEGLPTVLSPTPRLIGANMSVRSTAFRVLGGFNSADFDDLDMCTRLAFEFPDSSILYEPRAVVHHFVPKKRVTWHYFWTRSFLVNRDKVPAFAAMGEAASLAAERSFLHRSIRSQSASAVQGLFKGSPEEVLQLAAMLIGFGLAGLGNLVGRLQMWREHARPATGNAL
jgi:GT2 family glycosyltransferase